MEDMPVYLFTGFLEAGKTKFIQGTLSDPRFNEGERTLLLLCEEGEEEYDVTLPHMKNIWIEPIENESDLTPKVLEYLADKHKATRVLVEYNGMWQLSSLFKSMPDSWTVYQRFMFADAGTFLGYNSNLRSLVVDKLANCDIVIFNRFTGDMDPMDFHKIVRGISRRANIAYEYENGEVKNDDIEDPLPFDLNAPVIQIEDEDYALWFRDVTEEPKKYNGKIVEYKGIAALSRRLPPGAFAFGRHVMTCCEADIQFASFLAQCDKGQMPENAVWYTMRLRIDIKFHKLYGRKGPILTVLSMEKTQAPAQEVATFY